MPMRLKKINVQGKWLKAFKYGNPNGVPVLVAGPASIYIESLKLEQNCCLYGVDHYWTTEANIPLSEIRTISTDQLAHDLESYRKELQKTGEPVEKVVVLGPSAVGLTAAKYASFYNEHVLGVIMLNTPLGLIGLQDAQDEFFDLNYNPNKKPGKYIKTELSVRLWKTYQKNCDLYKTQEKKHSKNELNPDKNILYMSELLRDEPKYYQNPEVAKEMYAKWPNFNIDMRNQFFTIMQKEDVSFLKDIKCPVLNSLGVADGIVPFPFVLEKQRTKEPVNYTPYIFKSAHMPPLEDKDFPEIIKEWMTDQGIRLPDMQFRSKL